MGRTVIKDLEDLTEDAVAMLVAQEIDNLQARSVQARSRLELWTVTYCEAQIKRVSRVKTYNDWQAYVSGR
jgi:hypothetical protein